MGLVPSRWVMSEKERRWVKSLYPGENRTELRTEDLTQELRTVGGFRTSYYMNVHIIWQRKDLLRVNVLTGSYGKSYCCSHRLTPFCRAITHSCPLPWDIQSPISTKSTSCSVPAWPCDLHQPMECSVAPPNSHLKGNCEMWLCLLLFPPSLSMMLCPQ